MELSDASTYTCTAAQDSEVELTAAAVLHVIGGRVCVGVAMYGLGGVSHRGVVMILVGVIVLLVMSVLWVGPCTSGCGYVWTCW